MPLAQISLCGSEDFGNDRQADDQAFKDKIVTWNQFAEQPELIGDHALVIKHNNRSVCLMCQVWVTREWLMRESRYLTWDTAAPILASLAIYRRSLGDYATASGGPSSATHRRAASVDSTKSRWSRWWGKSSKAEPALPSLDDETASSPDGPTSAPVSPPEPPSDSFQVPFPTGAPEYTPTTVRSILCHSA
jgi:phosphatidate phosphatase LPIN